MTEPQIEARNITAALTVFWQELEQSERDLWNLWASQHTLDSWTGQPKRISGYNWFIKLNYYPWRFESSYHNIPLPALRSYLFENLNASWVSPNFTITWTPQNMPADYTDYVIWRIEGPYKCIRTANIKRAGTINHVREWTGTFSSAISVPGWYAIHIWWQGFTQGYMPPNHIWLECT